MMTLILKEGHKINLSYAEANTIALVLASDNADPFQILRSETGDFLKLINLNEVITIVPNADIL